MSARRGKHLRHVHAVQTSAAAMGSRSSSAQEDDAGSYVWGNHTPVANRVRLLSLLPRYAPIGRHRHFRMLLLAKRLGISVTLLETELEALYNVKEWQRRHDELVERDATAPTPLSELTPLQIAHGAMYHSEFDLPDDLDELPWYLLQVDAGDEASPTSGDDSSSDASQRQQQQKQKQHRRKASGSRRSVPQRAQHQAIAALASADGDGGDSDSSDDKVTLGQIVRAMRASETKAPQHRERKRKRGAAASSTSRSSSASSSPRPRSAASSPSSSGRRSRNSGGASAGAGAGAGAGAAATATAAAAATNVGATTPPPLGSKKHSTQHRTGTTPQFVSAPSGSRHGRRRVSAVHPAYLASAS